MIEEGGAADLEHVAVLRAQIVAVEQRAGAEQIDVGAFDELVAEQHIADRRMDQRRAGRDIGVGLILRAEKNIADQPLRRGLAGDFGEVLGDARAHLGRRVGRRGLCEIAPGDLERPHAEIQRAELEVDPRQVGVEQQHAFERRHRRLVVAELGRRLGISKGRVEVGRVAQHLLEQRRLFRFQLGALVGRQILRRGGARYGNDDRQRQRQQPKALQAPDQIIQTPAKPSQRLLQLATPWNDRLANLGLPHNE